MTNEEAIERLKLHQGARVMASDGITIDEEETKIWNEACTKAIDALGEQTKYRWHDLRKDPEDLPHPHDDSEFYDCVVENHEHDSVYPAYQYSEEYEAFGFYQNRLDPVSLGYADCEFKTVEELGHEKVIAWREIELFEEEKT